MSDRMKPFHRNTGTPPRLKGKRVVVKLRSGDICGENSLSATTPPGWAVETTRWSLTGSPWDVMEYRVL